MTPGTPNHYGTLSRILHWDIVVAIAKILPRMAGRRD